MACGVRCRRPQYPLGGPYPVGVALLLAQHPVQPGRERAAQAVRAEHQGGPYPVVPVRAGAPDEQLCLDGAGPVHDHHTAGVAGDNRRDGHRPGGIAGPSAERAGQHRVQVDTRQVAHDDCGRRRGPHVSLVEGAHACLVDPCDGVLGALARPGKPRGRREQLLRQLLGRTPARAGHLQRNLVETVAHQPLDLAARERGRPQRLGEQPKRLGQAGDGNLQRDARARVVDVRVECRAAAFQLGGEFLGGVLAGALGQRTHHDRGDTVEPVGLRVERHVQADLHGHHLLAGPVAAQHGQPAGEGAALGHGERPGLRLPGRRLGVEVHGHRCVGHRLAPSRLPSSPAAPAWSPADRPCLWRSPARIPAPRGCRGAAAPRPPPGPLRR